MVALKGKIVQKVAGEILELFLEGQNPIGHTKLKSYKKDVINAAFRLLCFERMISMQSEYRITSQGRSHIDKHGCVVYPNGGSSVMSQLSNKKE